MSSLGRTLSHGTVQKPLSAVDDITFPSLTTTGPHTDAFQEETATGLVSAKEVEGAELSRSTTSTRVDTVHDVEKAKDAKLVTWLENDPENPRNLSKSAKWVNTGLATLLCFVAGFGSSIITGGLDPMAAEFHVSGEVINLSVCVYVVGFGLGPLFFSPLSEVYGRRVVYLISMAMFFVFTIPSAVAKDAAVLIVFRFLAGVGASACMCLAGGSIADCWDSNERGYKMVAFSATLFASPCVGPPIGGYIAMYTSWRWIYWVLLIFIGVAWLAAFAFLKETYSPVLLARRARQLRQETGDQSIMTEQELHRRPLSDVVFEALVRPLVMLFTEPIMALFSAYLCLIYGLLYGFFFSYPIVFQIGHNFSWGQTGLCFFGILIGIALVAVTACPLQEQYYQRKVAEGNGQTIPESRLPLMMGCAVLLPISLFIFAWTSIPSVSWVGPAVAGVPFGYALIGIYISANTYLVEVFSSYAASAMAAKTFIRSMVGASMPMWITYMYTRLGNGWAGSVLAFISLAMIPIPFTFFFYGEKIRQMSNRAS
ncbi:MFS general substrate transporter [Meredithblackwellia eburnea MCA 4105]